MGKQKKQRKSRPNEQARKYASTITAILLCLLSYSCNQLLYLLDAPYILIFITSLIAASTIAPAVILGIQTIFDIYRNRKRK